MHPGAQAAAKTIFDRQRITHTLCSKMAYLAVLPVLWLDDYWHGKQFQIPKNFDQAYAKLATLSRRETEGGHKVKGGKTLWRWEKLLNDFNDRFLPMFENLNVPADMAPIVPSMVYSVKPKYEVSFPKAKNIVDECLQLLFEVKKVLVACEATHKAYVNTIEIHAPELQKQLISIGGMIEESKLIDFSYNELANDTTPALTACKIALQKVQSGHDYMQSVHRGGAARRGAGMAHAKKQQVAQLAEGGYAQSRVEFKEKAAKTDDDTYEWLEKLKEDLPEGEVSFIENNFWRTIAQYGGLGQEDAIAFSNLLVQFSCAFVQQKMVCHQQELSGVQEVEVPMAIPLDTPIERILQQLAELQTPAAAAFIEHYKFCLFYLHQNTPASLAHTRPESFEKISKLAVFEHHKTYFTAAHAFVGKQYVRGWLRAVTLFKDFREGLADNVLLHMQTLQATLWKAFAWPTEQDPDSLWLRNLIKPFDDGAIDPSLPVPMQRGHMQDALSNVNEVMHNVYNAGNVIKGYHLPSSRSTEEQQKTLFTQFYTVVGAIKQVIDDAVVPDLKHLGGPGVQVDGPTAQFFVTAIKTIQDSLFPEGKLSAALQQLITVNGQLKPYEIKNLKQALKAHIDIEGEFSGELIKQMYNIAALLKTYLEKIKAQVS